MDFTALTSLLPQNVQSLLPVQTTQPLAVVNTARPTVAVAAAPDRTLLYVGLGLAALAGLYLLKTKMGKK